MICPPGEIRGGFCFCRLRILLLDASLNSTQAPSRVGGFLEY